MKSGYERVWGTKHRQQVQAPTVKWRFSSTGTGGGTSPGSSYGLLSTRRSRNEGGFGRESPSSPSSEPCGTIGGGGGGSTSSSSAMPLCVSAVVDWTPFDITSQAPTRAIDVGSMQSQARVVLTSDRFNRSVAATATAPRQSPPSIAAFGGTTKVFQLPGTQSTLSASTLAQWHTRGLSKIAPRTAPQHAADSHLLQKSRAGCALV